MKKVRFSSKRILCMYFIVKKKKKRKVVLHIPGFSYNINLEKTVYYRYLHLKIGRVDYLHMCI